MRHRNPSTFRGLGKQCEAEEYVDSHVFYDKLLHNTKKREALIGIQDVFCLLLEKYVRFFSLLTNNSVFIPSSNRLFCYFLYAETADSNPTTLRFQLCEKGKKRLA